MEEHTLNNYSNLYTKRLLSIAKEPPMLRCDGAFKVVILARTSRRTSEVNKKFHPYVLGVPKDETAGGSSIAENRSRLETNLTPCHFHVTQNNEKYLGGL